MTESTVLTEVETFRRAVETIAAERGPALDEAQLQAPSALAVSTTAAWLIEGRSHVVRLIDGTVDAWGSTASVWRVKLAPRGGLKIEHLLMAATVVGLLDPGTEVTT